MNSLSICREAEAIDSLVGEMALALTGPQPLRLVTGQSTQDARNDPDETT